MKDSFSVIRCPSCGYEYVASEIFLPNYLLGKPKSVIRDLQGNVEYVLGDKPIITEHYCCDNCNTHFKSTIFFEFETTIDKEYDFDTDYKTVL